VAGSARGALEGQAAIVTGAGRGIGRAIALSLAAEGAKVALIARTKSELEAVAREIAAAGGQAAVLPADVSAADEVARALRSAEKLHGSTDLLVNNAGVVARVPLKDLDEVTWDRVLDVNLKGAYLCSRAATAGMIQRGKGRVVNIASISATVGTARHTAYCASKWGLVGFTKALAEELRDAGVLVCAVLPGSVDTGMLAGSGFAPDMKPEEVARVVRFLCCEAPFAMTGSAVEVFG
jgi:NAD(P)-dependent dehydrogenase (short-subunit alcohol dehydrogenase family)